MILFPKLCRKHANLFLKYLTHILWIGISNHFRDLVQLQLPGIMLRAMPVAPPQIPWHAGYSYFELEKGSELWHEMDKSGAFALHLAGEFPGLDMEFWAIRSPTE